MRGLRSRLPAQLDARTAGFAVGALSLLGLLFRLSHIDNTFVGDELSTLYIVRDFGFFDAMRTVSTDAEISPPLYFGLAWLFTKLSSAPEMVRVPALIAGMVSIPLVYMVGRRAIGRGAGVIAAAVMALNPFMIFYATDGRGYTVAIALLLTSTLAMLLAVQTGRHRWWVLYGAATCLCMYAHYTTAFVLGAQLLWLIWARPEARKAALVANAGAAAAFLPWVPSLLEDLRSPTIEILDQLQGDGFDVKREAVESWAFGYPFNLTSHVPGMVPLTIGVVALGLAAAVAAVRYALRRRAPDRAETGVAAEIAPSAEPRGTSLMLLLFLATPVAEAALLFLGGSDLFGARNLNTASGGFALSVGAVLTAAGPLFGTVCGAAVLAVFAVGATKSLETRTSTIDFRSAASFIEAETGPGDVVLDMLSPVLAPVPLTPIDVYLPQDREEYRVYLPAGPPPFLNFAPEALPLVEEAFRAAQGKRIFLVAAEGSITTGADGRLSLRVPPSNPVEQSLEQFRLPVGARVLNERSYPGLGPVNVYEIGLEG